MAWPLPALSQYSGVNRKPICLTLKQKEEEKPAPQPGSGRWGPLEPLNLGTNFAGASTLHVYLSLSFCPFKSEHLGEAQRIFRAVKLLCIVL